MKRTVAGFALALLLAVVVVRVASSCSPLCAVIGNDIWNPLWWFYDCGSCPPNPPDAG